MSRTVSQTINLQTPDQTGKYITKIDGGGISIHDLQRQNLDYIQLDSNGLKLYKDGGNYTTAEFGSTSYIGKRDGEHSYLKLDYHSLSLIDKEKNTFFEVIDGRDESGEALITQEFWDNGLIGSIDVDYPLTYPVSSVVSLIITSSDMQTSREATEGVDYDIIHDTTNNTDTVHFYTLGDEESFKIDYLTTSSLVKSYILGKAEKWVVGDNASFGGYSVMQGYGIAAHGFASHAEGGPYTVALGDYSHAEGYTSRAEAEGSHAEGYYTQASAKYSHAEGRNTHANNDYAHSEGEHSTARGLASHAEGDSTLASGNYSHTLGGYTIANRKYQVALGMYNLKDYGVQPEDKDDEDAYEESYRKNYRGEYVLMIGNGTANDARSNALMVDWNGAITIPTYRNSSWVAQRDSALLKLLPDSTTTLNASMHPYISMKTESGDWTIATYSSNRLYFSYVTDTDYNNETNTQTSFLAMGADGYLNVKNGYHVSGSPLITVKSVTSSATTIAANSVTRIQTTFTLEAPYKRVVGIRQITTNHNIATVISGFGADGDGAVGNTVTVFADCRNLQTGSAISDEKVTFEVVLSAN